MTTLVALLSAAVCAVSYGIGSVLQAEAAARTEKRRNLDAMLLVRLLAQLPYVAGLGLDVVGFVASLVALHSLPLFLVQAAVAGSVGVTALASSVVSGRRLQRIEVAALIGLVAGFVALALSARPEHAATLGVPGRWALAASIGAIALLALVGARRPDRIAGIVLGLCAGLGWAVTGIASRVLHVPSPLWRLLVDPVALVLAASGVLGMLLFGSALQRGSVTAAGALVCAAETVVPATVGLALLGDRARPGLGVLAVAGVVVSLAASLVLAWRSPPPEARSMPTGSAKAADARA